MFRVKSNLQTYLNIVRPWAMGTDNRGWQMSDFRQVLDVNGVPVMEDRPDVKNYRTDLAHVIFPLLTYNVTVLDRLFLPQSVLGEVMFLNQKIAAFNASLDAVNATEDKELRWQRIVLLHVGTIGNAGGPGIFEQFTQTEAALHRSL